MLITRILPAGVRVAECFGDEPTPVPHLGSAEAHAAARMSGGRRREFLTTRACARRALADLGVPPAPVPVGPDRAPQWPIGVVGSLTHCRGYRAAAVAAADQVASVGIDAEPARPLPASVLPRITSAGERAALRGARPIQEPLDRALFSAKESVFKAWYPVTRRYLAFGEAEVTFERPGEFVVRLLVAAPADWPDILRGRYVVGHDLVLTAVVVPRAEAGTALAVAPPAGRR